MTERGEYIVEIVVWVEADSAEAAEKFGETLAVLAVKKKHVTGARVADVRVSRDYDDGAGEFS